MLHQRGLGNRSISVIEAADHTFDQIVVIGEGFSETRLACFRIENGEISEGAACVSRNEITQEPTPTVRISESARNMTKRSKVVNKIPFIRNFIASLAS